MVSNYKITGTDLDDYFYARVTTKRADVGFKTAGVDISNTYETLSGDQQIPDINAYSSAGVDLAQLFTGNNSQYTAGSGISSTRTTAWNTAVYHEVSITFASVSARTDFFTYGGRLKWSASRTGGSTNTKNTNWSTALSTAGSLEIGLNNTYKNGSLTAYSAVGEVDLTTSYQTIHTANIGGVYTSSILTVQVKEQSTTEIRIYAKFEDSTVENVDENVDGTLVSNVDYRKYPTQATPTFSNTIVLTSGS